MRRRVTPKAIAMLIAEILLAVTAGYASHWTVGLAIGFLFFLRRQDRLSDRRRDLTRDESARLLAIVDLAVDAKLQKMVQSTGKRRVVRRPLR